MTPDIDIESDDYRQLEAALWSEIGQASPDDDEMRVAWLEDEERQRQAGEDCDAGPEPDAIQVMSRGTRR